MSVITAVVHHTPVSPWLTWYWSLTGLAARFGNEGGRRAKKKTVRAVTIGNPVPLVGRRVTGASDVRVQPRVVKVIAGEGPFREKASAFRAMRSAMSSWRRSAARSALSKVSAADAGGLRHATGARRGHRNREHVRPA